MKFAQKILLFITITALLSIVVIGYFSYFFTRGALEEDVINQQQQLGRQTMDKIDRLLYERRNEIQVLASDVSIQNFLTNQIYKGTAFEKVQKKLDDLTILSGPWDELLLVAKDGTVAASTNKKDIGENINAETAGENVFLAGLSGKTSYSDALVADYSGKPIEIFASPVRDANTLGQPVVGVMVGHLTWLSVTEILNSITGTTVDLYNNKGLEIGNNDKPAYLFKENNRDEQNLKAALSGKEESGVGINIEKTETVNSSIVEKGFATYKGNKWVLLLQQPTTTAFAAAQKTSAIIAVVFVLITIFTSLFVLFFILKLLRPIGLLTQTAQQIAEGDLGKRVQTRSHDELGILSNAFNYMADSLQKLYVGLEEKVKERTMQLEAQVAEEERINKIMLGRELKMVELKEEIAKLKDEKNNIPKAEVTKVEHS